MVTPVIGYEENKEIDWLMELGGQPNAMASVPQRKETLELNEREPGWGLRVGWGIWIREYLLPVPCSELHLLGHPANNLVTIPTALSHSI
jgi:hypothetical protein